MSTRRESKYINERKRYMKITVTPRGFAKCGLDNVKRFEEAGFALEYNDTPNAYTKEAFYEKTLDADGIIVGVEQVDKAYIDSHPKLKAVVKFGVGTDNIDVAYCQQKGIFVGKTAGSNARSVAETAISFILADSKNLYESILATKQHSWAKLTGYEIENKVLGIVGFGNIVHLVAELLHVFGCKILVHDIKIDPEDEMLARLPIKVVDLPTLMRESDIVTLHVRGLEMVLTREMLSLMQPHAFLINTARAWLVDYDALYELLRDRKIMGAAIEVHPEEPLPTDYPFLSLDCVTLTTHRGGATINAYSDSPEMLVKDYARYLAGGKVRFFVNPEVGFGK